MRICGLRKVVLVGLTVCCLSTNTKAQDQTLLVRGHLAPEDSSASFIAQVKSDQVKVEGQQSQASVYRYSMDESTRLLGSVQVSYAQTPPGYQAGKLTVRVPYRSSAPLQVSLYAIKPVSSDEEGRRIRQIFATVIAGDGELRHEELYRLYQETRAISRNRLERIKRQDDFNYPDAQILFKFLEISVRLGREASLAVSPEVLEARNFVRIQMRDAQGLQTVLRGTRQSQQQMLSLLNFVDFVEADQLKSLWATVKQHTKSAISESACKQYLAFSKTITGGDYDSGLVDAWEKNKDYGLLKLAAEAVGACATLERDVQAQRRAEVSDTRKREFAEIANALESASSSSRVTHQVEKIRGTLNLSR